MSSCYCLLRSSIINNHDVFALLLLLLFCLERRVGRATTDDNARCFDPLIKCEETSSQRVGIARAQSVHARSSMSTRRTQREPALFNWFAGVTSTRTSVREPRPFHTHFTTREPLLLLSSHPPRRSERPEAAALGARLTAFLPALRLSLEPPRGLRASGARRRVGPLPARRHTRRAPEPPTHCHAATRPSSRTTPTRSSRPRAARAPARSTTCAAASRAVSAA
jgi:hypothetical protein